MDNPGWTLDIDDLARTHLSGIAFGEIKVDRSDSDWLFCWVEDEVFRAPSGPLNLTEAIESFCASAASATSHAARA
ncbi:MAG TPA: Imm53 family immunity protein [Anaeromyxobacteraceae bacterium]|nr:Imm53 family immunity protein [Anaeromyxobacteraceae bacterium]